MADIARRIELYNQAFQLAHEHIARDQMLRERPDIGKELHDAIRRQIANGTSDVVAVAAGAVRALEARRDGGA